MKVSSIGFGLDAEIVHDLTIYSCLDSPIGKSW
jgi:hypothetical protein